MSLSYNEYRRKTRAVKVGNVYVGGNNPIPVQSMTNVSSSDYDALYTQIKALENAGCDIVRMTVPDDESVRTLYRIKCSFKIVKSTRFVIHVHKGRKYRSIAVFFYKINIKLTLASGNANNRKALFLEANGSLLNGGMLSCGYKYFFATLTGLCIHRAEYGKIIGFGASGGKYKLTSYTS